MSGSRQGFLYDIWVSLPFHDGNGNRKNQSRSLRNVAIGQLAGSFNLRTWDRAGGTVGRRCACVFPGAHRDPMQFPPLGLETSAISAYSSKNPQKGRDHYDLQFCGF